MLGVVVVVLVVVANEWHIRREAAALERRAFALIGALELPPWMIEVERQEVGFHCHFWSGCQERFVAVVYEIDASEASPDDRARPCAALVAALHDWDVEHAPRDRCEVFAARDGAHLTAGVFEDGFLPLRRDGVLDRADRAQLSMYP